MLQSRFRDLKWQFLHTHVPNKKNSRSHEKFKITFSHPFSSPWDMSWLASDIEAKSLLSCLRSCHTVTDWLNGLVTDWNNWLGGINLLVRWSQITGFKTLISSCYGRVSSGFVTDEMGNERTTTQCLAISPMNAHGKRTDKTIVQWTSARELTDKTHGNGLSIPYSGFVIWPRSWSLIGYEPPGYERMTGFDRN